ncbi:hypothetical protein RUM43_012397 [Polyplax serrata]|uniref:Uncharacterized protein n=1 Tax=Polyplax serrata TaxID=468196 RepID=A0AAN8NKM1_POLSC
MSSYVARNNIENLQNFLRIIIKKQELPPSFISKAFSTPKTTMRSIKTIFAHLEFPHDDGNSGGACHTRESILDIQHMPQATEHRVQARCFMHVLEDRLRKNCRIKLELKTLQN